MSWWGWLGGFCAATTVALAVAGQQLFSAVVDGTGLFRIPYRALTRRRLAVLALMTVGSALVQLA